MALTKYTASTAIIAALSDLPNATDGLTAAQLKAKFDESPTAFKTFVNSLIDELEATTDGSSGADSIGSTTISGLTGNTVQVVLEALKTLVDTKAATADTYTRTELNNGQLDTRYFTETEIQATTDSASGADKTGATAISGLTGATVQALLESLKALVDSQLPTPDGSITNTKLATDVKVGSLAALTTTNKSSVVAAVNEHLADDVTDAGGVHGLTLENGVWTPILNFGGLTTDITYTAQQGIYIKQNNLVYFEIYILLSSKGTATGAASLGGFPFAPDSTIIRCIMISEFKDITLPTGAISIDLLMNKVDPYIRVSISGSATNTDLNNTHFNNTSRMLISGNYQV